MMHHSLTEPTPGSTSMNLNSIRAGSDPLANPTAISSMCANHSFGGDRHSTPMIDDAGLFDTLTDSSTGGQFTCPLNSSPTEARMRRVLRYFFMNPWDKYRAKRTVPYKLFLQLLKILLITIQLVIFGFNSSDHVTFSERNLIAFKHVYLRGWDSTYESLPYPPSHGTFAVYTYNEFFDTLDYAMSQYNLTLSVALGSYAFAEPQGPRMGLCKKYYRKGQIFATNQSYEFDSQELLECIDVQPVKQINTTTNKTNLVYDSKLLLAQNNMTINFDRLITVWLNFSLKSVHLKAFDMDQTPDCYRFDIQILFNNLAHNGQISLSLVSQMMEIPCHGTVTHGSTDPNILRTLVTILDVVVILLSVFSGILCARSLMKAWRMYKKTVKFFQSFYSMDLKGDKWEFLNLWYILIIINDILIVFGSIYKIQLDNKEDCYDGDILNPDCIFWVFTRNSVDDYSICSYMLGLGSLLVWIGVLRYLGFSYKNNILILTLKKAMPNVLRFIGCALVIYIAFSLCAWVILGPYHIKFRSFFSTLECLFALINGDDLFATFAIMPDDYSFVFFFSKVYLYLFCALFIYVVLNLFITLILEAYEEIKKLRANHGHPDTPLWQFIRQCPDDPRSPLYMSDVRSGGWRPCDWMKGVYDRMRNRMRRRRVDLDEEDDTPQREQSRSERELIVGVEPNEATGLLNKT